MESDDDFVELEAEDSEDFYKILQEESPQIASDDNASNDKASNDNVTKANVSKDNASKGKVSKVRVPCVPPARTPPPSLFSIGKPGPSRKVRSKSQWEPVHSYQHQRGFGEPMVYRPPCVPDPLFVPGPYPAPECGLPWMDPSASVRRPVHERLYAGPSPGPSYVPPPFPFPMPVPVAPYPQPMPGHRGPARVQPFVCPPVHMPSTSGFFIGPSMIQPAIGLRDTSHEPQPQKKRVHLRLSYPHGPNATKTSKGAQAAPKTIQDPQSLKEPPDSPMTVEDPVETLFKKGRSNRRRRRKKELLQLYQQGQNPLSSNAEWVDDPPSNKETPNTNVEKPKPVSSTDLPDNLSSEEPGPSQDNVEETEAGLEKNRVKICLRIPSATQEEKELMEKFTNLIDTADKWNSKLRSNNPDPQNMVRLQTLISDLQDVNRKLYRERWRYTSSDDDVKTLKSFHLNKVKRLIRTYSYKQILLLSNPSKIGGKKRIQVSKCLKGLREKLNIIPVLMSAKLTVPKDDQPEGESTDESGGPSEPSNQPIQNPDNENVNTQPPMNLSAQISDKIYSDIPLRIADDADLEEMEWTSKLDTLLACIEVHARELNPNGLAKTKTDLFVKMIHDLKVIYVTIFHNRWRLVLEKDEKKLIRHYLVNIKKVVDAIDADQMALCVTPCPVNDLIGHSKKILVHIYNLRCLLNAPQVTSCGKLPEPRKETWLQNPNLKKILIEVRCVKPGPNSSEPRSMLWNVIDTVESKLKYPLDGKDKLSTPELSHSYYECLYKEYVANCKQTVNEQLPTSSAGKELLQVEPFEQMPNSSAEKSLDNATLSKKSVEELPDDESEENVCKVNDQKSKTSVEDQETSNVLSSDEKTPNEEVFENNHSSDKPQDKSDTLTIRQHLVLRPLNDLIDKTQTVESKETGPDQTPIFDKQSPNTSSDTIGQTCLSAEVDSPMEKDLIAKFEYITIQVELQAKKINPKNLGQAKSKIFEELINELKFYNMMIYHERWCSVPTNFIIKLLQHFHKVHTSIRSLYRMLFCTYNKLNFSFKLFKYEKIFELTKQLRDLVNVKLLSRNQTLLEPKRTTPFQNDTLTLFFKKELEKSEDTSLKKPVEPLKLQGEAKLVEKFESTLTDFESIVKAFNQVGIPVNVRDKCSKLLRQLSFFNAVLFHERWILVTPEGALPLVNHHMTSISNEIYSMKGMVFNLFARSSCSKKGPSTSGRKMLERLKGLRIKIKTNPLPSELRMSEYDKNMNFLENTCLQKYFLKEREFIDDLILELDKPMNDEEKLDEPMKSVTNNILKSLPSSSKDSSDIECVFEKLSSKQTQSSDQQSTVSNASKTTALKRPTATTSDQVIQGQPAKKAKQNKISKFALKYQAKLNIPENETVSNQITKPIQELETNSMSNIISKASQDLEPSQMSNQMNSDLEPIPTENPVGVVNLEGQSFEENMEPLVIDQIGTSSRVEKDQEIQQSLSNSGLPSASSFSNPFYGEPFSSIQQTVPNQFMHQPVSYETIKEIRSTDDTRQIPDRNSRSHSNYRSRSRSRTRSRESRSTYIGRHEQRTHRQYQRGSRSRSRSRSRSGSWSRRSRSRSRSQSRSSRHRSSSRERLRGSVEIKQCICCQSQGHKLQLCPQFTHLPLTGRWDFITNYPFTICTFCLESGHHSRHCSKDTICRKPWCGQRYHKFLHLCQDKPSQAPNPKEEQIVEHPICICCKNIQHELKDCHKFIDMQKLHRNQIFQKSTVPVCKVCLCYGHWEPNCDVDFKCQVTQDCKLRAHPLLHICTKKSIKDRLTLPKTKLAKDSQRNQNPQRPVNTRGRNEDKVISGDGRLSNPKTVEQETRRRSRPEEYPRRQHDGQVQSKTPPNQNKNSKNIQVRQRGGDDPRVQQEKPKTVEMFREESRREIERQMQMLMQGKSEHFQGANPTRQEKQERNQEKSKPLENKTGTPEKKYENHQVHKNSWEHDQMRQNPVKDKNSYYDNPKYTDSHVGQQSAISNRQYLSKKDYGERERDDWTKPRTLVPPPLPQLNEVCSVCRSKFHVANKCPQNLCANCQDFGHQVQNCKVQFKPRTERLFESPEKTNVIDYQHSKTLPAVPKPPCISNLTSSTIQQPARPQTSYYKQVIDYSAHNLKKKYSGGLWAYFDKQVRARGLNPEVAHNMMAYWELVGHSEASLKSFIVRNQPASQVKLRALLLPEIAKSPHKGYPDGFSIDSLLDETIAFLLPLHSEESTEGRFTSLRPLQSFIASKIRATGAIFGINEDHIARVSGGIVESVAHAGFGITRLDDYLTANGKAHLAETLTERLMSSNANLPHGVTPQYTVNMVIDFLSLKFMN